MYCEYCKNPFLWVHHTLYLFQSLFPKTCCFQVWSCLLLNAHRSHDIPSEIYDTALFWSSLPASAPTFGWRENMGFPETTMPPPSLKICEVALGGTSLFPCGKLEREEQQSLIWWMGEVFFYIGTSRPIRTHWDPLRSIGIQWDPRGREGGWMGE